MMASARLADVPGRIASARSASVSAEAWSCGRLSFGASPNTARMVSRMMPMSSWPQTRLMRAACRSGSGSLLSSSETPRIG